METIQVNKQAILDLVQLKDNFDSVVESLELMGDKDFMDSFNKSKKQIGDREFDEWDAL